MLKKYRDLEIPVKSQSRSLKVVLFERLGVVSYYCSIVTLSLRCTVFLDIRLQICCDLENRVWVYDKVIENVTIRQSAYDFLLTFHSNHRPILYHFRDRWWFQSKIAKFSHTPCPLHTPPSWRGSPWNWVPALRMKKLEWWGYWANKEV